MNHHLLIWRHERIDVFLSERLSGERRRERRERLRGRRILAGRVRLRHGTLLNGPKRLAGLTVKHEQETMFRRLRNDVDTLAVMTDGQKLRSSRQIIVPQIVMNQLIVPETLAGLGIQSNEAVCKEIVSLSVAAVKVVPSGAKWNENDSTLHIDRHFVPVVDAAG